MHTVNYYEVVRVEDLTETIIATVETVNEAERILFNRTRAVNCLPIKSLTPDLVLHYPSGMSGFVVEFIRVKIIAIPPSVPDFINSLELRS